MLELKRGLVLVCLPQRKRLEAERAGNPTHSRWGVVPKAPRLVDPEITCLHTGNAEQRVSSAVTRRAQQGLSIQRTGGPHREIRAPVRGKRRNAGFARKKRRTDNTAVRGRDVVSVRCRDATVAVEKRWLPSTAPRSCRGSEQASE